MSVPLIQILASKIAEEANTCSYRSDGWQEEIEALALAAINEAVAAEQERCARLCDRVAANYTKHFFIGATECAKEIRAASAQHLDTSPALRKFNQ